MANEKKFNVLDEKWIYGHVRGEGQRSFSVLEALEQASEIAYLDCENMCVNASVLRFLLGILYTAVLKRAWEEEWEPDEVLDFWKSTWEEGQLPMDWVLEYLNRPEIHDRFWLVHPTRGFMQYWGEKDSALEAAKPFPFSNFVGDLGESNNSTRAYKQRCVVEENGLEFPEMVRWLLFNNNFDARGTMKKLGRNDEILTYQPRSNGWLGNTKPVYAQGKNLFESLMLNLVLLKDSQRIWSEDKPFWELDTFPLCYQAEYICKSPVSLYTHVFRRVELEEKDGKITQIKKIDGSQLHPVSKNSEQNSFYCKAGKNSESLDGFELAVNDLSELHRRVWTEMEILCPTVADVTIPVPGSVKWIAKLLEDHYLSAQSMVSYIFPGVVYDKQNSVFVETLGDNLSFVSSLLLKNHEEYRFSLKIELFRIQEAGKALKSFEKDVQSFLGNAGPLVAEEELFVRMDPIIRSWLMQVDPEKGSAKDYAKKIKESLKYQVEDIFNRIRTNIPLEAYFMIKEVNKKPLTLGRLEAFFRSKMKKVMEL